MQFGLFLTPQFRAEDSLDHAFTKIVEQVQTARDQGFGLVLVGQHLLTGPDMKMLQTLPLIARLLPETQGMRIGPGVLLLPLLSPVLVAEETATIDWLSGGNFVLAAGLGYRQEEFDAMGINRRDRVPILEESIEVIKKLWTTDRVDHSGRFFRVPNIGASVRPKQSPRPPIWLGGDVKAAVQRAARIADAWLGSPTADMAQLQKLQEVFRRTRAAASKVTNCRHFPLIRECFVGRDRANVDQIQNGPLMYKYKAYSEWGHNDTADKNVGFDFDAFCENRFLLGDQQQVLTEIHRYRELLGTEQMVFRVQWPGMTHAEAVSNIERIGALIRAL